MLGRCYSQISSLVDQASTNNKVCATRTRVKLRTQSTRRKSSWGKQWAAVLTEKGEKACDEGTLADRFGRDKSERLPAGESSAPVQREAPDNDSHQPGTSADAKINPEQQPDELYKKTNGHWMHLRKSVPRIIAPQFDISPVPKKMKVFVLSPDATDTLDECPEDAVYVFGGLADRAVKPNKTMSQATTFLQKAFEEKHGKGSTFMGDVTDGSLDMPQVHIVSLPLKEYGPVGMHRVLNIDVAAKAVLLRIKGLSWEDALNECVPKRHKRENAYWQKNGEEFDASRADGLDVSKAAKPAQSAENAQ